ncbi:hypothetical protein V2I01_10980 [Micromonospora sp. BRA006-A]|nr:hypothetical protein [Micromonospora sp. BRA006-A]
MVDAELIEPEPEAERQPSRIFDPVRRIYVRNPKYVRRASGSSGVTALGIAGPAHHADQPPELLRGTTMTDDLAESYRRSWFPPGLSEVERAQRAELMRRASLSMPRPRG